jgi:hypothetical protein
MDKLPPQPTNDLDQAAASILEPELPAGGIEFFLMMSLLQP